MFMKYWTNRGLIWSSAGVISCGVGSGGGCDKTRAAIMGCQCVMLISGNETKYERYRSRHPLTRYTEHALIIRGLLRLAPLSVAHAHIIQNLRGGGGVAPRHTDAFASPSALSNTSCANPFVPNAKHLSVN
jgi:hypothetical protein